MSIFDAHDGVSTAPSWRCPHCGTLQAESSRCWRCTRSVLICASCHLFRRAVVGGVGYCAADRTHAPLSGDEVRGCWQASPEAPSPPGLFPEQEFRSRSPVPAPPADEPHPRRVGSPAAAPKPPLEDVRAAAWADTPAGGWVEAPRVDPRRRVTSEVQRRRRRWRR